VDAEASLEGGGAGLVPDPENANRGTERGHGLIEQSFDRFGAARSAVADADGVIRAGNKSWEEARRRGLKVKVIKSDGQTYYVIQRTDLKGALAKEYGIADNRTAFVDYDMDPEVIRRMREEGVQLERFFLDDELAKLLGDKQAPGQFKKPEVDADAEHTCPKCGYRF